MKVKNELKGFPQWSVCFHIWYLKVIFARYYIWMLRHKKNDHTVDLSPGSVDRRFHIFPIFLFFRTEWFVPAFLINTKSNLTIPFPRYSTHPQTHITVASYIANVYHMQLIYWNIYFALDYCELSVYLSTKDCFTRQTTTHQSQRPPLHPCPSWPEQSPCTLY